MFSCQILPSRAFEGLVWCLSFRCLGPRGPLKGPRGPLKGPRGPLKGTRGPLKGPRGPLKGPRGPLKGSRGPLKGPRGPLKGPRGPLKGPWGPFKGPRGPLKGPRGPLKGPRGGAGCRCEAGHQAIVTRVDPWYTSYLYRSPPLPSRGQGPRQGRNCLNSICLPPPLGAKAPVKKETA